MNLTKTAFALGFTLIFAAATLRAQTGCVDSPEDPTVILALVGLAGAFAVSMRGILRRKP